MISRAPIDRHRVRHITGSFSWLDHRLLSGGFLAAMAPTEMLLYFFLVLVGDKNGISFYAYDTICTLLKMDLQRLLWARDRLVERSLIACQDGRYQVLHLPDRPVQPGRLAATRPSEGDPEKTEANEPRSLTTRGHHLGPPKRDRP